MQKIIREEDFINESFPSVVTSFELDNSGFHYYRPWIFKGVTEEGFILDESLLEDDYILEKCLMRPNGAYAIVWDKDTIKRAIKNLQYVLDSMEKEE